MEFLLGALRVGLWAKCFLAKCFWAKCFIFVKLAGAFSVRMRHSSSRKTMSMTQYRLYSTAKWPRIIGAIVAAGNTSEVMQKRVSCAILSVLGLDLGISRLLSIITTPRNPGQSWRSCSHAISWTTMQVRVYAMIAVGGLMPADRRILEIMSFLLVHEDFDVVQKRPLIALERENVIGSSVLDILGDLAARHKMASIVTMAPSISIISSSAGMAAI